MQGNAGEYRGIQGNARGMYGSGCKVPAECWGMLGNAGICQGNVQEWVQSARGIQGMPGEPIGIVGTEGRGMLGNVGECQGNVWEWV